LEAQDWAVARGLLDMFAKSIEEMGSGLRQLYDMDQIDEYMLQTYTLPVLAAIEHGDFAAANTALDELQTARPANTQVMNQLRVRLINVPLADAITLQDWASAASLYRTLLNQSISRREFDRILLNFPE